MLLTSLIKDLAYTLLKGDLHTEISSLAYDSREVKAGGVFVAISGFSVDGHRFIDKALELGATVIVVEKDFRVTADVTVLRVDDTREALARLAANFYQRPTEQMNLLGITGTNGKTSITYFLKSIFEQTGTSLGIIGTIGTVIGDRTFQNKNTTPESLNLQHIFADMIEAHTKHCVMEVSSHALNLNRVAHSSFNTGIFTNLTPDHLELHHTMEEYFEAKAKLFAMTTDYNIINADDPYGKILMDRLRNQGPGLITYAIEQEADIYATDISYFADYTTYTVNTPKGSIPIMVNLPGAIYVYNSLAAIATAYCNQFSLQQIADGIAAVTGIKGRLEVVYQDEDNKIIVDFAHTEDSLEKALTTIRPFTAGKIILVFGVYAADGESGTEKRRSMAKVAATFADFSVITSDNPKEQDNTLIIREIVEGIEAYHGAYEAVVDRRDAIAFAIEISQKGDVILIAGKGHETTQIIGKTEIPFNEPEIVKELMRKTK
ncbi:UDP-N-acetylmuramoyl-L-alanyl-D-glutamate--2,6-diaminopimelate ligase [Paenibacillus sp. FSL H8-0548]|uniref:UDP-N-acetylmuramoyl-L-alanyl-D-glutamate--2, 6-diaminopimelate ligase n=1 Tax=Paenibacillus sp. FSL H8-0548 TaxID=1920422 RepID=UPI00096DDD87|nr:UDP-N-acetylmuramoyl-L-alanyl-D-glutamate--2,6-diaminopimelate ligase [Paenibacillus sp. FSL H8-0548]OMF29069.1 UDP-N-acetylmuramoyl-L-alanyl-D-glutamate--2,6-diaminopimelate ligase [Paenibacillus sp. FSL H8-0548]